MNHAFYKNGIYVALAGFGDNDNKPADSAFVLHVNVPVVSMGVLTASIFIQQAYFKGFYLFPSELMPALLEGLIVDEYLFRDLHKESYYEDKNIDIEKLMFVVNRLCPDGIRVKTE